MTSRSDVIRGCKRFLPLYDEKVWWRRRVSERDDNINERINGIDIKWQSDRAEGKILYRKYIGSMYKRQHNSKERLLSEKRKARYNPMDDVH